MITSCFLSSLYRDTAPVRANSFVTGDNFLAPLKFVPRSGSNSTKILPECKTYAIPSLHRDSFLPEVPLSARCLRQVTLTNYTAAPLAQMADSVTELAHPPLKLTLSQNHCNVPCIWTAQRTKRTLASFRLDKIHPSHLDSSTRANYLISCFDATCANGSILVLS